MSFFHLRTFLAAVSILGFTAALQAQSDSVPVKKHYWFLRTNPLSFAETDGNITLGIQYRWNADWAATLEPAYIFFTPYENEFNQRPSMSGIKLRADVRYTIDRIKKGVGGGFIAPEFHFKQVASKVWEDFGYNCINGQCAYFQRAQYRKIKREFGGALKAGSLIHVTGVFYMELFAGIGFKIKEFTEKDIPAGAAFLDNPNQENFFRTNREGIGYLMLPMGIKLVFLLN